MRHIKKSAGHHIITTKIKYEFMQSHASEFSIERMSNVFNVSPSGYYGFIHAKPSARAQEDERLHQAIKKINDASRQTYGSPRIFAELSV